MYRGGSSRRTAVVILVAVLLMAGLVAVTAGGCGGGDAADTTTTAAPPVETTSTTASTATTGSVATTASTAAQGQPSGQIGGTASVSSTNGGYPKENAPDWSQIKSVEAYTSASFAVRSIWVVLATDAITAGSVSEYKKLSYPEPGHGRIELLFTRSVAGENEPPMVTGTYDFNSPQGKVELTGEAKIILPGGSAVQFAQGALESDVQITAVSETEVTGTYYLKDKWSEISGTFTAPIK